MDLSAQVAKHFKEVYFGGNWTCSNVRDQLSDVTWQQAITPVRSFNTIATLVFHMDYFVEALLKVLKGGPLDAHDKFSFAHPPIASAADWQTMMDKTLRNAEETAQLIGKLPSEKLWENMAAEKYGSFYRNIHGTIEHTHYHLGQIAILKKMLQGGSAPPIPIIE